MTDGVERLDRFEQDRTEPREVVLTARLVVRGTTAEPFRHRARRVRCGRPRAGRGPRTGACGRLPPGYHRGVNTYWHVVLPPLCA
ncbi:hypothetical protein AVL59_25675 [Streptomyces griseochromogenes]|uniref:Uncharacterized protein n=1 Tax=Streptomyces griseochromogenes TaxID=68214 RepID=A0A1B1B146_9ACTN|nr:hypothetical protein [Streptomyces griseochromogenes]ANP52472.1 hypothetical protein AVL59_25675 [Streptomyces griseochromogenes]